MVVWDKTFGFECKLYAPTSTGVLDKCILRLSVRKVGTFQQRNDLFLELVEGRRVRVRRKIIYILFLLRRGLGIVIERAIWLEKAMHCDIGCDHELLHIVVLYWCLYVASPFLK